MALTAEQMVTLIDNTIEARLNGGAIENYSINGRSLANESLTRLRLLREYYRSQIDVSAEGGTGSFVFLEDSS